MISSDLSDIVFLPFCIILAYIDDIVDGIVLASHKIKGYNTYNLGNNEAVVLSDLIELISKSLGKPARIKKTDVQLGDVDHTLADINKAKSEIGYNPKTSIQDGLEQFVRWYKNEKNRFKSKQDGFTMV